MADGVHMIEVPAPEVAWVLHDADAGDEVPACATGRVTAGQVVIGVGGVSPCGGEAGRPEVRLDGRGRRRWAVPVVPDEVPAPPAHPEPWPRVEDAGELAERLAGAGVRPDRHNSPDLPDQLRRAARRPTEAVIAHALEADPTLPVQSTWALLHPRELRNGLRAVRRATGAGRAVLAVAEEDYRRIVRSLRRETTDPEAAEETEDGATVGGVRVVPVANAYPQADPSLLVRSLLRRRLPPGRSPTEAGAVVLDAVAAVSVGRAAAGRPDPRRPVGVRDHRRDISVLATVLRGTRAGDVARFLGMRHRDPDEPGGARLRGGDFLREMAVDPAAVLDDGEATLHVFAPPPPIAADPCVRCGWCLDICPTGVRPVGLLDACETGDPAVARRNGAAACVGCGLCGFVCPSRLPLTSVSVAARDRLAGS